MLGDGMTAKEFDAATPREVQWRLEAMHRADELEWERTAQLASWVAGLVGVKVSAKKLLGKADHDWSAFTE